MHIMHTINSFNVLWTPVSVGQHFNYYDWFRWLVTQFSKACFGVDTTSIVWKFAGLSYVSLWLALPLWLLTELYLCRVLEWVRYCRFTALYCTHISLPLSPNTEIERPCKYFTKWNCICQAICPKGCHFRVSLCILWHCPWWTLFVYMQSYQPTSEKYGLLTCWTILSFIYVTVWRWLKSWLENI